MKTAPAKPPSHTPDLLALEITMTVHDLPPSPLRSLAYAHAVTVAIATRHPGTGCAGCGRTPCRCVPITPAELAAVRAALSAAITGTDHPTLTDSDRRTLVAALADAACWRTLSGGAVCERCHPRPADPDSACPPCEHNRADLDTAADYQRLGRWLAAFTGWAPTLPEPASTDRPGDLDGLAAHPDADWAVARATGKRCRSPRATLPSAPEGGRR